MSRSATPSPCGRDSGVDRADRRRRDPGSLFQSLNPLLVILMTPLLLVRWRRQRRRRARACPLQKMAIGALIVAASYRAARGGRGAGRRRPRALALAASASSSSSRWASSTSCRTGSACSPGWRRRELGATTVAAWYPRDLRRQPRRRPGRQAVEPHEPRLLLRCCSPPSPRSRPASCCCSTGRRGGSSPPRRAAARRAKTPPTGRVDRTDSARSLTFF